MNENTEAHKCSQGEVIAVLAEQNKNTALDIKAIRKDTKEILLKLDTTRMQTELNKESIRRLWWVVGIVLPVLITVGIVFTRT